MSAGLVLVCPTANRVASLRRSFESYLANARRHGRGIRLVVADNSESADVRQAYRQMLRELAAWADVSIRYIGLEEKVELARVMVTKGVPPSLIRFALRGTVHRSLPPIGGNYNTLLLATAGYQCVSVDDDTICDTSRLPLLTAMDAYPSEAHSSNVPFEFLPCESPEDAAARVVPADLDFFGSHSRWLGASVNVRGATRTTRLTLNGMVGDCGWASPTFYLLLTGHSLERLAAHGEAAYRRFCTSRSVVKGVPHDLHIGSTENMMCMTFGFDNRTFMPPFLPVGRGCDHLCGLMMGASDPDAAVTYLPLLIRHAPVEVRRFSHAETARSASGVDLGFLVGCLVKHATRDLPAMDGPNRASAIGSFLKNLGASSGANLRRELDDILRPYVQSYIEALEQRVGTVGDRMRPWANDVARVVLIQRASLASNQYCIPLDVLIGQDLESGTETLRRLVVGFGDLLCHWCELVSVTRQISHDGFIGTECGDARWPHAEARSGT